MVKLVLGLVCVMLANIILGTSIATIKKQYSKAKFISGIFKAFTIIVGAFLMYLCSYLNPDILVAEVNGLEVNLINGMKVLFTSGIVLYGAKDLKKLSEILKIKGE
jgi:small basic protein